MSNDVPKAPNLNAAIRAAKGLPPKTMAEELAELLEARLLANGGKWVPMTLEELRRPIPPAPDLVAVIRQSRTKEKK